MSDLIKRQAAINELVRWGKIPGYSRGERNVIACVIGMLDTLPSAQSEIIRCKDCKFYTHTNRSLKVGICSLLPAHFGDDGYCSEAERRSDG